MCKKIAVLGVILGLYMIQTLLMRQGFTVDMQTALI